jgi:enoyl-CoA hydratase/carnithine racemase
MTALRIVVETPDPAVRRIVLSRPEALNAIDVAMREALETALVAANRDPAVRCRAVV